MNSLIQETDASEIEKPQLIPIDKSPGETTSGKFLKEDPDDTRIYSLDKQILHKVLGQNLKQEFLKEFFEEFPVKPRFTHGRILEQGELYFRCIDCEVIKSQTQKTYYCLTCFEKKSHKGHRFLLFNNATGAETCDCGDAELLNPEFCCDDHGTCTIEMYNDVLNNFPAQFKTNYMSTFQQAIYEFLYSCELQRKENRGFSFKTFLVRVLDFLIKGFQFCIGINNVFLVLIGETLTQPFKKPAVFKDFFFLDERAVFKHDPFGKEAYNMTYLEMIMRYAYMFKEDLQYSLREFILKLARCHEFKSRLVISFHKVVHYQFKVNQNDAFKYTNLIHLSLQAYASEKNCVSVIQAAPFTSLINILKRYAKFFEPKFDQGADVLAKCLKIFELILEKENSGRQLIESQGIMNQFVQVAGDFQKVHSYMFYNFLTKLTLPDYNTRVMANWEFEHKIYEIVNPLMKNIGIILNEAGWDKRPDLFVSEWSTIAKKDQTENGEKKNIHLNLPIQRTLIAYLQYTLEKIHIDSLTTQLGYIKEAAGDSMMHLLGQTLSTIGLMRNSLVKSDYDFEKYEVISKYFIQDPAISIFDYDFTFVQLTSFLIESENEEFDLFSFFYKHFFGHDESLIKMFSECTFDSANKQQIDFFADFLSFLVQIMHGEISFFNVFYKGPNLEDHVSQKVLDQIHRKILINFLHKKYEYFSIANLKHDFKYLLRTDLFHEKILKDIADIEKRSRNFKLKKSFLGLFDGFYIYADPKINNQLLKNVRTANKKPDIAEIGNFSHNLMFLSEVQQRMFEGSLVAWIDKFLGVFKPKLNTMLPFVLRLILLALKLLEKLKKYPITTMCKDKIIYPFFGAPAFMEKLKKLLEIVKDPVVENAVAKLLTIFVPKTNLSISMLQNPENDESKPMTAEVSMMSSFINQTQNDPTLNHSTLNMQQILEQEDGNILCAICFKKVDLSNIDVGIPAYISKSNMNYWEFQGKKFKMGPKNTEEEEIRKIIRLIYRYYPYAGSMRPRDLDLLSSYKPPKVKGDFYPAVTSCMHYFHKSCFFLKKKGIGFQSEFECPCCKCLSNIFIGMEKVNATTKQSVEEQYKKDKLFLDFLRKQGVKLGLLPDPNLKFDFYNNFMKSIYPKSKSVELVKGDAAADKKILRFTNLLRASYFQLVRNSLINDFESFIGRSFLSYKFAFTNLQSFIMKNFQFHKFFEERDEMPFTVFHLLNHKAAMESQGTPTVKQLREAFKVELGLDKEEHVKDREEEHKQHLEAIKLPPVKVHKHDHKRRLPAVPVFSHKKEKNPLENEKYREILLAYEYRGINLNPLVLDGSKLVMFANSQLLDTLNSNTHANGHSHAHSLINDTAQLLAEADLTKSMIEKGPDDPEAKKLEEEMEKELEKEDDKFDSLQKMLLLFENDIEEDYLMVFWEVFLKFIVTGRTKEYHTNLDLRMLPVDFLFLKTLSIFGKTLISEGIAKPRLKLPEYEKLCEWMNKDEGIKNIFIEEMINLSQRIVISCIIAFDFAKCYQITKSLDELSELKGDRAKFLNKLLSVFRNDLTVEKILTPEFLEMSNVYPKFFAVWKSNLEEYIENSANPFFLFVKNITPIKPLIIELPSNFNEFNGEYLPKKCDNCGEFCNYCRTVVCLLCGKILCREKCLNPPKKYKKKKKKKLLPGQEQNDTLEQTIETSNQPDMILDNSMMSNARNLQSRNDNKSTSPDTSILTNKKDPSMLGSVRTIKISRDDIRPKKGLVGNVDLHLAKTKLNPLKESHSVRNLKHNKSPPLTTTSKSRSPNHTNLSASSNLEKKKSLNKLKSIDYGKLPEIDKSPKNKDLTKVETDKIDGKVRPSADDSIEVAEDYPEGNMPEHAMKEHKGHTIYIGIQDINVILFSNPRLAIYPDKLYVDRFGQLLSEKVNIFDEDWNAFEMNPFLLKRLRDTVENHKIPQLIYAISKNYDIKL